VRWGHPTYDIVSLLKETGCIPEAAPQEVEIDLEAIAKAGAEFVKQNNNAYAKAGKPGFVHIEEEKPKDEDKSKDEKAEDKSKDAKADEDKDKKDEKKDEESKEKPKEEKKEKPKVPTDKLMKEQNITDKMFWDLEEGDFENMLEVKEFGTRKKLMKKIKQIKADFSLAKEKEDRHAKRLSEEEK